MLNTQNSFTIDLNCDLGEGDSIAHCDKDAMLIPFLSSCNIACGAHAGSAEIIEQSMLNAASHQINIGAHPGYPDKENFGRITPTISVEEVVTSLKNQLSLFFDIAQKFSLTVSHIKLHGALYNDVEKNSILATAVTDTLYQLYPKIKVFGLANGQFKKSCLDKGISFVDEGFIDRTYTENGQLTPRNQTNAVITLPAKSAKQALQLAQGTPIKVAEGKTITLKAKTLCIHGDNNHAMDLLQQVYNYLSANHFKIKAPS